MCSCYIYSPTKCYDDDEFRFNDTSTHEGHLRQNGVLTWFSIQCYTKKCKPYSETCVRKPPLRLGLVVDEERWLSYKGTCHVILLAKLQ